MISGAPSTQIAAWLGERVGMTFKPPYSTLASFRDGRIEAACVFQSWTDNDIEVSVAADHVPLALVRAAGRYVFGQLGCSRATFRTHERNMRAQQALARLGALYEGRLRRYYTDGGDALVYGVLKEEYQYGIDA